MTRDAGSNLSQEIFHVQLTMLSRLVTHPCLRGLSCLRSYGEFLPAEGTMTCCLVVPIPCSLEFLPSIFWIRLSLFQTCSLQVKAGKGTDGAKGHDSALQLVSFLWRWSIDGAGSSCEDSLSVCCGSDILL